MTNTDAYKLLTAAIAFRDAYKNLCHIYNKIYDADFTEQYPLGQIDLFDQNTCDGIVAWLNCQTTKLINSLPDRVINPSCISCILKRMNEHPLPHKCVTHRPGVKPDGSCDALGHQDCFNYPFIVFDAPLIKRFLQAQHYDPTIRLDPDVEYDDTALRVLYNKLLNNLHIEG